VQSKTTLKILVQVSRAFREIFTPFLYESVSIQLEQLNATQLANKDLPPGLRHAKVLDITIDRWPDERPYPLGTDQDV